jgi:hypothetical protein
MSMGMAYRIIDCAYGRVRLLACPHGSVNLVTCAHGCVSCSLCMQLCGHWCIWVCWFVHMAMVE